jgi:hypothetical protein
MRLDPSRAGLSCKVAALLIAGASLPAFAAQGDIYKVGSWVSYKMDIKTETPAAAAGGMGAMGPGGMGAMGPGGMGMDPKMLEMLPPEKRAKIEAQMKAAQAQQAASMAASQKSMKSAGAGGDPGQMMKDMNFKIKLSVVGAEKRDDKDYLWIEMAMSGNMPDIDKMMAGYMANMPPDQQAKMKEQAAKSKEQMKKMPMITKDGRHMKMVMKMLIEKPDPNSAIAVKPVEMWKLSGDNPVVKTTAEEMAAFGKGESESEHKKKSHSSDEMEMHSKMADQKVGLVSDEKKAQMEENADKFGQIAKMGKAAAAVIPGGQAAAAGLGVLGEMMDVTKDLSNLTVSIGGGMDIKSKSETKSEEDTKTVNKLVSTDAKVVGAEDIDVPGAGTVKAMHTMTTEIHEQTTTSKVKSQTKSDTQVKADMHMNVGVDGGAQSTTGKVLGGMGKVAGFLSHPMGKKADADPMAGAQTVHQDIATDVTSVTKSTKEDDKEYWVSPEIPGMGLAKMMTTSQEKSSSQDTDVKVGMNGQAPAANPYADMMKGMQPMGGAAQQPEKPKTIVEMVIDKMGTSGAKSELE